MRFDEKRKRGVSEGGEGKGVVVFQNAFAI
jgi:hypothetical protein